MTGTFWPQRAAKVDVLVTFNLRDFPTREVASHGILVSSPDDFIFDLAQANKSAAVDALVNQSRAMMRWPRTPLQITEILRKNGLTKVSSLLADAIKPATR